MPTAVREFLARAARYGSASAEMPAADAHLDRFLFGIMQPVLGLRTLAADRALWRAALYPAGLLACVCAAGAVLGGAIDGAPSFAHRFYRLFAMLAPMPSIVLAAHYGRMAATARRRLGFGPCEPCIEGLRRECMRALKQVVLFAVAFAPAAVLGAVPLVGGMAVKVAAAVWALHWVVVDAFDSARVLEPGETVASVIAAEREQPRPWFVRGALAIAGRLPRALAWPARLFARVCDRLGMPFRDEIHKVESHPMVSLGFALTTAALLATPVLNLLFRPIIVVAACHAMGRLGHAMADAAPVAEPGLPVA